MAHGSMEDKPFPKYVCKNGGKYLIRNKEGEIVEHCFITGEKVDISHELYIYFSEHPGIEHPCWRRLYPQQLEMINDDHQIYHRYNRDYYGDELFIDKQTVQNSFRPIIHKHPSTKLFTKEDEMNEFLATLKIDCLKDIKIGNNNYLVIYIDMGDDE